jgi:predicted AlkP superfamily phosphohydrolase/phosphomutase
MAAERSAMARRRIVLLGIDSVSLESLETFVRRGVMPATQRLMARGVVSPMTSFHPVDTGTNWASIATGASPQVHGCNMRMHLPGAPLDQQVSSFPNEYLRAEPLWDTAQRAGRTAVVFDWPHSYPFRRQERLLHVGEDGRPDNAIRAVQEVRAYTTELPERRDDVARRVQRDHLLRVTLAPAAEHDWRDLPAGTPPVLAAPLPIVPGIRSRYRSVDSLWALVWPERGAYARVTLHAARDAGRPLASLRLGERSPQIRHTFVTDHGSVSAAFQAKLLRLSADAREFHLYLTEIYPTEDFAAPASLAEELLAAAGPFIAQPSRQQVVLGGASDIATYFEEQVAQGAWYERALRHVLTNHDWDVCLLKWHSLDWTNHLFAYATEPRHPLYDPAREAEAWAYWDRLFAQADRLVDTAWEVAQARGPAVLGLTSDHGSDAVPPGGGGHADLNGTLEASGWLVREQGQVDWKRTRAYGFGSYVWLNRRGRDPDGIVEAADYASERDRLIETLLASRDPQTGAPLLRTVLPVEDAAPLGVGGDRTGDLYVEPWHSATALAARYRRAREQAGDGRYGTWDWPAVNSGNHHPGTFLVLAGDDVRRGYRRPRAAMLNAIAPTLALLAGLPVPADTDGAALWDVLEP